MTAMVKETKRILREHFGLSETDAHWAAANGWTDHGRLTADLELARKQALANLEAIKARPPRSGS
jgi:aspartokinase-like uncharacterized kinase